MQNAFTKIQVIATSDHPLGLILENYSTTPVVNFISWNKAYSVFPFPTFIRHEGFYLKPRGDANERMINKYTVRGWELQKPLSPNNRGPKYPMQGFR